MTPEAFYRACDTGYEKSVPAADFKSKLEGLKLDINDRTIGRIIQILDEDYNGHISWREYIFALQTYQCLGEDPSLVPDETGQASPQIESVFKMISVMKERKLTAEELFKMIDIDGNGVLNLNELDEVVKALSDFQKKEIKSIHSYFDID